MQIIDRDKLRDALDIACAGGDRATLARIAAVYKVLTPKANGTRIDIDVVRAAGFVVNDEPRHAPFVWARDPGDHPRRPPDVEEMLRMAYAFALAGTPDAPQPGWAAFDRFSSGLHMLDPSAKTGKKLRNQMDGHPLWRIESHVPKHEQHGFRRLIVQEDEDDCWDMYVACSAGDPGAKPHVQVIQGIAVCYVRPRLDAEQPRSLLFAQPGGEFREGPRLGSLKSAWSTIANLPRFVLEEGASIRVRREPDGFVEAEATFSRGRDCWILPNGGPISMVSWDGDNLVIKAQPTG